MSLTVSTSDLSPPDCTLANKKTSCDVTKGSYRSERSSDTHGVDFFLTMTTIFFFSFFVRIRKRTGSLPTGLGVCVDGRAPRRLGTPPLSTVLLLLFFSAPSRGTDTLGRSLRWVSRTKILVSRATKGWTFICVTRVLMGER